METVIDWSKKPEGATHYAPAGDDRAFRWFNMDKGQFGASWMYGRWDLFDRPSNRHDMVKIEQPWTGEGLPPVGTVCEFATYHGGDPVWKECKIIAHDDGFAVIAYKGNYSGHSNNHLRPIRTPEQIAAEERKAGIDAMRKELTAGRGTDWAEFLYDAGYRKQVAP